MLQPREPSQLRVARKYELIARAWLHVCQLLTPTHDISRVVVRPYEHILLTPEPA